jgi:hypothetical protein
MQYDEHIKDWYFWRMEQELMALLGSDGLILSEFV